MSSWTARYFPSLKNRKKSPHDFFQGNSLSCDMRDAFASNDFTDMTIVCDKREFHCHKFLLAARCYT